MSLHSHRRLASVALSAALFCSLAAWPARSAEPTPAAGQETSKGTAVIYPYVFQRNSGTKTSRATAVAAVREVLQKAGYTLISDTVAKNTWNHLRIPYPTEENAPRLSEFLRFGKAVKARYVVSTQFYFHSRSIWVNLGPKTISTVTADVAIVDVRQGKVVYQKEQVQGRSDEKSKVVKMVAAVFLTPLVTVVSGGPKTPQEQKAARIAVGKALLGWVQPGGPI